MKVDDAIYLRVSLERDRIETHFGTNSFERGLKLGEGLHRCCRPDVLIALQQHRTQNITHRHHRLLEPAFVPGAGPALVAARRGDVPHPTNGNPIRTASTPRPPLSG